MGLLGKIKLAKRTLRVVIGIDESGNPVELIVRPPRMREVEALQANIPEPVAPARLDDRQRAIVVKVKGRAVMHNGSKVIERDYEDPAYMAECERHGRALTLCLVLSCVGDQINAAECGLDYEQHKKDGRLIVYYSDLWDALEVEGLDVGAFKALVKAATALGAPMTSDEIESARKRLALDEETQEELRDQFAQAEKKKKKQEPAGNVAVTG